MKLVMTVCVVAGTLAAVGCDGRAVPTSPSAFATVSGSTSLSAAPRSGDLHVTKECGSYHGQAGEFCTITTSNVKEIEVGSRVIYAQAAGPAGLDSDVLLDVSGPGNNRAFGHCTLNFAAGVALCTFSGGTGKFTSFSATAHVSPPSSETDDWHWDGTYSFTPRD